MTSLLENIATTLLTLIFVLSVVVVAWYLLWTFILAPNPLVRDFFDLDRVDPPAVNEKKKDK